MPDDPKTAALDELGRLVAERDALERRITEAVAAARQGRATWTDITAAINEALPAGAKPLLRPNVERKYKALLDEQVTVTVRETEA